MLKAVLLLDCLECFFQEFWRVAFLRFGHLFRCACGENGATATSTFRSHVNDVVCQTDDIKIVFNDDDGVTTVNQALQHIHQNTDVLEVETCSGLVKDIKRLASIFLRQFCG